MKKRAILYILLILLFALSSCDYTIEFSEEEEKEMVDRAVSDLEILKDGDNYNYSLRLEDREIKVFKYGDWEFYVERGEEYNRYFYKGFLYTYDEDVLIEKEPFDFEEFGAKRVYTSLIDSS